jgi:hypothetical protein
MDTQQIKAEVDKNLQKLQTLRDEVKVRLHLASLEAKTEWDEKLEPKVFEMQNSAKNMSEHGKLGELVTKVEQFLGKLGKSDKGEKSDKAPHSTH